MKHRHRNLIVSVIKHRFTHVNLLCFRNKIDYIIERAQHGNSIAAAMTFRDLLTIPFDFAFVKQKSCDGLELNSRRFFCSEIRRKMFFNLIVVKCLFLQPSDIMRFNRGNYVCVVFQHDALQVVGTTRCIVRSIHSFKRTCSSNFVCRMGRSRTFPYC